MNPELNQAIDFDRVLEQIGNYASFSCSIEKILNSYPLKDRMEIQNRLDLAKEAMNLIQKGETVSFSGCIDVSQSVKKNKEKNDMHSNGTA